MKKYEKFSPLAVGVILFLVSLLFSTIGILQIQSKLNVVLRLAIAFLVCAFVLGQYYFVTKTLKGDLYFSIILLVCAALSYFTRGNRILDVDHQILYACMLLIASVFNLCESTYLEKLSKGRKAAMIVICTFLIAYVLFAAFISPGIIKMSKVYGKSNLLKFYFYLYCMMPHFLGILYIARFFVCDLPLAKLNSQNVDQPSCE